MESAKSNKRYYWVRMEKDFFVQKEIKKLRKIAGGDTYTIIFLKLQLLSLDNDKNIYFDGVENSFEEEIALAIDEDLENVKVALSYLLRIGWIEEVITDEATFYKIIKIEVGSETASASRVRKHREQLKSLKLLQCNASVTSSNKSVMIEEHRTEDLEKQQQHNNICCVVDNSVSVQDVLTSAQKLHFTDKIILSLIQEHGIYNVYKQLNNLKQTKNIRNNGAWIRSALEKNYELAPSANPPAALPDCPSCHGTGKIEFRIGDTSEIISRPCPCLHERN